MENKKTADVELQDLVREAARSWLENKEKESSKWNERIRIDFQAIKDSSFLEEIFQVGIVRGLVHAVEIASGGKGE